MSDVETRELSRDLSVAAAQRVVPVLVQRSAEIDGVTRHSKIVRKTCKDGPIDVLLNTLEDFLVALVPAVDNDARAIELDAESLQREQTAFQCPECRYVGFGDNQDHPRHAQNRAPLRRELRAHIQQNHVEVVLSDVDDAI